MALVGIIDPSHAQRAEEIDGQFPNWLYLDTVLEVAAAREPGWAPWTYELLKTALDQWQERDFISVTSLTGSCGRGLVVKMKEDFVLGIDELYKSMRGTLIHQVFENGARPGSIPETRFFTDVYVPQHGDVELSCAPDLITTDTLWDYKMTENPPSFNYPWKSHTLQLQFNRYVVNQAKNWERDGEFVDLPFDPREWKPRHLAIVYIGPKGPKILETKHTIDVPAKKGGTKRASVPYIWSDAEVMKELLPRLSAVFHALDNYPEWPEGLENMPGFAGPKGWACPGRPLCNFDTCLAKRWPHGLIWEGGA